MDLTKEAIKKLELLKLLRKRRVKLELWDVTNEIPVGDNRELAIYNLRKQKNVMRMSDTVQMITETKKFIKQINDVEQIKIPLESNFARRAQGKKISSALLPSGLLMYDAVDDHEWVVRGNYAVLEQQIVEVD